MAYTKEQRIINQVSGSTKKERANKPTQQQSYEPKVTFLGGYIPNHAGIASHPEAVGAFVLKAGDTMTGTLNTTGDESQVPLTISTTSAGTSSKGQEFYLNSVYVGKMGVDNNRLQMFCSNGVELKEDSYNYIRLLSSGIDISDDTNIEFKIGSPSSNVMTIESTGVTIEQDTYTDYAAKFENTTTGGFCNLVGFYDNTTLKGSVLLSGNSLTYFGESNVSLATGVANYYAITTGQHIFETDTSYVFQIGTTPIVAITSTGLDVNGKRIILDVDGDTYLEAFNDDTPRLVIANNNEVIWSADNMRFNNGSSDMNINWGTDGNLKIGGNGQTTLLNIEYDGDTYWTGEGSGLPYGHMYLEQESSVTLTIDAAGTAYEIVLSSDWIGGETNLVTFSDHYLRVDKAGRYLINWDLSFEPTSTAVTIDTEAGLMVNGTAQSGGRTYRTIGKGGGWGNAGATHILDLAASDQVSLFMINQTNTQDIEFKRGNLSLTQIGGT